MYRANLSYSTLRKYLSAMSKQGLILRTSGSKGSRVYRATEKGRALLAELRGVKDYLTTNAMLDLLFQPKVQRAIFIRSLLSRTISSRSNLLCKRVLKQSIL
jgi:DNA-binding PadR family transcriptional regulator